MAERWKPARLVFTAHAIRQMFARNIGTDEVRSVAAHGAIVADYPDDAPYPSRLLLGFVGDRPLHLVLARDASTQTGFVITAYEPTTELWEPDFKHRRSP